MHSYIFKLFHAELVFLLEELVKKEDEDSGAIQVRVGVQQRQNLISDISLLLIPKVAPLDFTPLPNRRLFSPANTCKLISLIIANFINYSSYSFDNYYIYMFL